MVIEVTFPVAARALQFAFREPALTVGTGDRKRKEILMSKLLCAIAITGLLGTAGVAMAETSAMTDDKPSFETLDTNRDGTLSQAEVSKVKGVDFSKADTNRDGKLDRSEYQAAIG